MEIDLKYLKSMDLHEIENINQDTSVMKVPGGWIYITSEKHFANGRGDQWVSSSVFVPEK
jgi:hypothetical protein